MARQAGATQFFFSATQSNTGSGSNYADVPPLSDDAAVAAIAALRLTEQQALGKPLAVQVSSDLGKNGPADDLVLNKFSVNNVFGTFLEDGSAAHTTALVSLVQSTQSRNAAIGNFNFYPGMNQDPTLAKATG